MASDATLLPIRLYKIAILFVLDLGPFILGLSDFD
jgi:hypothetical protein